MKWLIERQLRVRDLEPEPEPLTRGSFIHAVLERVFAQLDGALTPDSLPEAERLLGEAIRGTDVAAERRRVASGQSPEVRAAVLRGIEAELRRYLSDESTDGSRFLPTRTELRFGLDPDSAASLGPVALGGDRDQVMLSGVIDRIDADPADPQRVIVRDYKSGAKRDTWPAARWVSDRQIQVALYMIAAQRLLGVRAVAGFYQPLSGEDRRPRGAYRPASPQVTVSCPETSSARASWRSCCARSRRRRWRSPQLSDAESSRHAPTAARPTAPAATRGSAGPRRSEDPDGLHSRTAPRDREATGELLLDAGAGSGKTSVLVERFFRAIQDDGIGIHQILTITFTEKAAAELRERIRARFRAGRSDRYGAGDGDRVDLNDSCLLRTPAAQPCTGGGHRSGVHCAR